MGYYKGEYLHGLRNGKGTLCRWDGNRYTGQWVNDKMEGYGSFIWKAENQKYTGQFLKDQRHGLGIQVKFTEREYLTEYGIWKKDERIKKLTQAEY